MKSQQAIFIVLVIVGLLLVFGFKKQPNTLSTPSEVLPYVNPNTQEMVEKKDLVEVIQNV